MLFHSLQFLLFFIIVHQVFWRIPASLRKHWLLLTSLVFYGWWSVPFLFHFFLVVALNYGFALIIEKNRKPVWLWTAIGLNLANLFWFKYANSFFTYTGEWFGITGALELRDSLGIALPLAISFYTFQIIAYLVDVWRGEVKNDGFLRFAVFIMFFPQLIAGPIMRHRDFLQKMDHPEPDETRLYRGLSLIALGIIKKIFIADELGRISAPVWGNPAQYDGISIFLAVLSFSFQVYGDFSGYTDMARGTGALLGYDLPENFFAPYFSTSFSQLWKRWHVTLSTWIRDYLYIPLGGNRVSPFRQNVNLLVVMTLGGVWHGDTYNYFFWGFLHGFLLVVEKLIGWDKKIQGKVVLVFRWLLVSAGWLAGVIFFRSSDLSMVGDIYQGMLLNAGSLRIEKIDSILLLSAFGYLIQFVHLKREWFESRLLPWAKWIFPVLATILFFQLVAMARKTEQFIYFQF